MIQLTEVMVGMSVFRDLSQDYVNGIDKKADEEGTVITIINNC
jgi:hypothetical protein